MWGGGGGVEHVCIYTALLRMYSNITSQTVCCKVRRRRRRGSVPSA